MFGIYFAPRPPRSYAEVMACDREAFNRFFHAMLQEGVYFAPSAFEAGFVSAAHTERRHRSDTRCRGRACRCGWHAPELRTGPAVCQPSVQPGMYSATAAISWSLMRAAIVRIMLEGSLARSPPGTP